jgi:hypothetical protein
MGKVGGDDKARKECEKVSQWLKGAGHKSCKRGGIMRDRKEIGLIVVPLYPFV